MRRSAILVVALAAATLAAASASASAPAGWAEAVDARRDLGAAQTALALGETERSRALVARAEATLTAIAPTLPTPLRRDLLAALAQARAAAEGDARALADARATAWTTLLRAGLTGAVADAGRGDAAAARQWLLVREFRAPTRFTRAGTDATLAVSSLARGKARPQAAARSIRNDLLDTYEAKLRAALDDAVGASRRGFSARLAEEASLARGYAAIVGPSYRSQRGDAAAAELGRALDRLERAAALGATAPVETAVDDVERLLEGFRAAPLDPAEQARRAGQLDRFLRLVPIEYDRGVEGTRVTLAFEIQEAISFRDAVAAALADISPELLARDPAATRELTAIVAALGVTLDAAGAGRAAPAETVSERTDRALELIDGLFPTPGRRPPPAPTSTLSPPRSTGSQPPQRWGTGAAPSRRGWRRTGSSSSGPSSGCAESRPRCSAGSRVCSGTATAARRGSCSSSSARTQARSSRSPSPRSRPSSSRRRSASARAVRPRAVSRTAPSSSSAKGSRRS